MLRMFGEKQCVCRRLEPAQFARMPQNAARHRPGFWIVSGINGISRSMVAGKSGLDWLHGLDCVGVGKSVRDVPLVDGTT